MKFTLGFSPCPNDTFIFDALVNKKIDTQGFEFDTVLADVETLNQWALEGKLDITKLSFPAFFRSLENYILLHAGSALGKGVGPLFICRNENADALSGHITLESVALPGLNTTAHLLFSYAYPDAVNKQFMVFSNIEDAVLSAEVSGGVIIHENRFTYQQKGLHKIKDLGEYWEEKTGSPIPLGGIAIKRSIDNEKAIIINSLIRQSLEYAFQHYPHITGYVREHSQEMSEDVMRQHIDLYVNDFSLQLGAAGEQAIRLLYEVFGRMHAMPASNAPLFL
ncbi:MAG: 1,4-dihydroxy-6-naphthoate synthase [Bacteroidetes bacterium]|nr:1,4-dihydroxy-6-naphthoate synthase [Bacteroidota bacterium]